MQTDAQPGADALPEKLQRALASPSVPGNPDGTGNTGITGFSIGGGPEGNGLPECEITETWAIPGDFRARKAVRNVQAGRGAGALRKNGLPRRPPRA
jgi:hypothetical protein